MYKYRFCVILILVTLFVAGCQKPSDTSKHVFRPSEANMTSTETAVTACKEEISHIILASENRLNHLSIEAIDINEAAANHDGYHVEATAGYRPSSPSGLYEDLSMLSTYLADTLEDQTYATVNSLKLNYRDDTHGQTIWYYYERIGEDLVLTDSHA